MKASFRNVTPERLIALVQFVYGPENVLKLQDVLTRLGGEPRGGEPVWCETRDGSNQGYESAEKNAQKPVRLHDRIAVNEDGTFDLTLTTADQISVCLTNRIHPSAARGDNLKERATIASPRRFFDKVREILGE